MEMNRGSLNPLFARRPRRLHLLHRLYPATSTWGSTPAWTFSTWLPRASAVRPCRFALYSLPPCLCSSPVPPLYPFLSRQQPSSSRFPRLACGAKSTRAAAAAVCPPNYAEFISYGARHACLPATPPGYFYSRCNLRTRARRIYRTAAATFLARLCGNVIFHASVCDVSM